MFEAPIRQLTAAISRLVIAAAIALVAFVLLVTALGFLIAALYQGLRALHLVPWLAALSVGGALIALAGIGLLVAMRVGSGKRKPTRLQRRPSAAAAAANGHAAGAEALAGDLAGRVVQGVSALAEAHPYGATSLALLAGLALGRSREMQDVLRAALAAHERR